MTDEWDARGGAAVRRGGLLPPPIQAATGDSGRAGSRRWFLGAGVTAVAGLSAPDPVTPREPAGVPALSRRPGGEKSVILLWLSGGLSHIDSYDPKPDAPAEVRGPFATIATRVPGVRV